jgi:hypothetical protein
MAGKKNLVSTMPDDYEKTVPRKKEWSIIFCLRKNKIPIFVIIKNHLMLPYTFEIILLTRSRCFLLKTDVGYSGNFYG